MPYRHYDDREHQRDEEFTEDVYELTRREFLKQLGIAGLCSAGVIGALSEVSADALIGDTLSPIAGRARGGAVAQSKVVLVRSQRVFGARLRINRGVLEKMLDQGMMLLTGEKTPQRAWEKLFSSDEKVGIKPNGLGGATCATSKELIELCIERLTGIGIKAENIYLWDQNPRFIRNWGFTVKPRGPGVRVFNVQGTWDKPIRHGSFHGRITRIITREVDAILNLPILKDHSIAGVTIAMKNHYGSIDNPGKHHGNNCDPYIADLNAVPAIKNKTRLIICDALRPLCQGGPRDRPQFRWIFGGLLLSTDPVAHDTVGMGIIKARRAEVGLPPLERVGRPPKHIATAAARGLGINDPKRIRVIRKTV